MKADLSRQTFDPARHYAKVLMQQGRVQLDADWNEQQDIQQYQAETEAGDVIGACGVPKFEAGGGFQIGVTSDGKDLTISPGRIYMDGILCELSLAEITVTVLPGAQQIEVSTWMLDGREFELGQWVELLVNNEAPRLLLINAIDKNLRRVTVAAAISGFPFAAGAAVRLRRKTTYNSQPDYFKPLALTGADALSTGRYRVYLDVWERHITSIEDPHMREIALGGPDTATRVKTVWQVKLERLGNTGAGDCTSAFPANWQPQNGVGTGKLKVRVDPGPTNTNLCVLPPGAGYQGLENQLYRVEVHHQLPPVVGSTSTPSFKWSRDNGVVVTAMEEVAQAATVHNVGRDDTLGFATGQLVEALDDRTDLNSQPGNLLTITGAVDRATRTIPLDQAPTGVDTAYHAKLRRWEGQGVIRQPTDDNDWISLESGLQIQFSVGSYKTGDYWLIPARTATSADTGDIEWPRDATGQSLAQRPHGVRHHYCPLALVDFDGTAFKSTPGTELLDCRKTFPALTAITAADVSFDNATCNLLPGATTVQSAIEVLCQRRQGGNCTLIAIPGPGWETIFSQLADNQDASICFQAGDYPLTSPVTLLKKGHLKLTGCGPGTRIIASQSEAAFVFKDCKSVIVRDLYAESHVARSGPGSQKRLNGVLTFDNCPAITVEAVTLKCAGGAVRAATCITVRNAPPPPAGDGSGAGLVSIRHCDLGIGHQQVGLLLVDTARAQVEDNILRAADKPVLGTLLEDKRYRAKLRRQLIANVKLGLLTDPATSGTNATVTIAGHIVNFRTDPALVRGNRDNNGWQIVINALGPGAFANPLALQTFLEGLADQILLSGGAISGVPAFVRTAIQAILNQDVAVAAQGIVLGGRLAQDVRILNNTLQDVIQGIHIGVSHEEAARGTPDRADAVIIAGNTVRVSLPTSATRERHAIFVGNSTSLIVENNYLTVRRFEKTRGLRIEGIRIFGHVGRRLIVRHNHLSDFNIGVRFNPLNVFPKPQWIITDNVSPQAATVVEVPGSVSSLVRGLNDNYA